MRFLISIICTTLIISCGGDDSPQAPIKKQLDTSFLSLAEPGTEIVSSQINKSENVIVLNDDQNINLEKNIILNISNFDISKIREGHILLGNSKDKMILKVKEIIRNGKLKVELGNIKDLSSEKDSKINFVVAPEINLESDESYEEINQDSSAKSISDGSGFNFKGNSLNFRNYEVINISGDLNSTIAEINAKKAETLKVNAVNEGKLKVTIEEGEVSFMPTVKGDYEFSSFKVKSLQNEFHTVLKYQFQIKVEADQKMSGMISKELFKDIKIPIRIPGAVPVYMDFIVKFPLGIKFSLADSLTKTFSFAGEYSLKASMTYDNENGPSFDKQTDFLVLQKSAKADSQSGKYQTEIFFEPRIETKLYRVLGPFSYINASLMGELNYPLTAGQDDIFASLSGGVGITVSEPIFEKSLLNLKSPSLFNLGYSVDVIGPREAKPASSLQVKDQEISVDDISFENRIAINTLPTDEHTFYKAHLVEYPKNGLILLDKNFSRNGLIYYYPVIEAKTDTLKVKYEKNGLFSSPATITLNINSKVYNKKKEQLSLSSSNIDRLESQTSKSEDDIIRYVPADIVKYNGENICNDQCMGISGMHIDPTHNFEEAFLMAMQSPNPRNELQKLVRMYMELQRPVTSVRQFNDMMRNKSQLEDFMSKEAGVVSLNIFKNRCSSEIKKAQRSCLKLVDQIQTHRNMLASVSSMFMALEYSEMVSPVRENDKDSFYKIRVEVPIDENEIEIQTYDIRRPLPFMLISTERFMHPDKIMDEYNISVYESNQFQHSERHDDMIKVYEISNSL